MLLTRKIVKKIKNTTKDEVKETVRSHKVEIFCGIMAAIALGCLFGVKAGPRPNIVYVTVNLKGEK